MTVSTTAGTVITGEEWQRTSKPDSNYFCFPSRTFVTFLILYYHIRATGALQDSSAAPSSPCVAVDDCGSSPLPLLAVLADGFRALRSCPP
jgi:hypothetical protein